MKRDYIAVNLLSFRPQGEISGWFLAATAARRFLALLGMTGLLLLLNCANVHAGDSKLTVALGKDDYITSGTRANLGKYPLNTNIFESLTTFDQHFRLLPCLAESWSYQGKRTWQFNLRKDVRFHDGSLLNAAAVRRSFEKQAESGSMLFQYEKINVPAEFVLDITTPEENQILPYILSHPYLGIVKAENMTVGTGPFKFVRHEKDQLLEVTRNEAYWGDKAKSTGITFRFLPDNAARMMAFLAKEADVLADLPWEVLPELQKNSNVSVLTSPVGTYTGLMLSLHGPLVDKDIRHAIAVSIDRQAISKALWHDLGETRQTMLAPAFLGADADLIADAAFDQHKAKELLHGKSVQLALISGFPNANAHGLLPDLLQAQLQASGFAVSLQKINDAGLYHALMKEGKGDLWLERGNLNSADLTFLPHLLFHQDGFYPKQLRTAAGNAAFAGFIAKARQSQSDAELRKNTALALREIINQDMLFIPIAELPFLLAVQKNVQAPELHPTLLAVRWADFAKKDAP